MSVTWTPRTPSPTAARADGAAPPRATASSRARLPANDRANTVLRAQLEKGGWKRAMPVLRQTQPDNCGAAVAAMLIRAAERRPALSTAELMKRLEERHTDGNGTTPGQLTRMLGGQGFKVTRGANQFDMVALENALRGGHKVLAQVDSNLVFPGTASRGPGASHWVAIDGMDSKGRYLVKDPARGQSYYVDLHPLTRAVNARPHADQGGGMLVVESAIGTSRRDLWEEGAKHCGHLGNTPGIGSRTSLLGRESGS